MKKKSKDNIIELVDFATKNRDVTSLIYTGRKRGLKVRDDSKIDELMQQYETIKVIIPVDVFSITPSFLEEFFFNAVRKYGRGVFENKIQIETNGYNISSQLDEAIGRILSNKSSIEK